jgi:hypothetical protein
MKFLRSLVVITLATGLSVAAVAAGDPQPAAPIPATQAGTPAVTPTAVADPDRRTGRPAREPGGAGSDPQR